MDREERKGQKRDVWEGILVKERVCSIIKVTTDRKFDERIRMRVRGRWNGTLFLENVYIPSGLKSTVRDTKRNCGGPAADAQKYKR